MTTEPKTIDRQTHARVVHPQRGEGVAVWRNGPGYFHPDPISMEGSTSTDPASSRLVPQPVSMIAIRVGGSNEKDGNYLVAIDPEHGEVKLRQLTHGDHHERKWSPIFGAGWMVWPETEFPKEWTLRWDGDDGRTMQLEVVILSVGTPDYVRRSENTSKYIRLTFEEEHWRTYGLRDGSTMAFRSRPPDPAPADGAQLQLGAIPAAKKKRRKKGASL